MVTVAEWAAQPATALGLVLASATVLAASGLVALTVSARPRAADRLFVLTFLCGAILGLAGAACWFATRATTALTRSWALPIGAFDIAIDGISACFLLPVLAIPAAAAVYGLGYWPQSARGASSRGVRAGLGILTAAMVLLVVARDAVLFLMAFEVMALAAFFLVATEHGRLDVRRGGWLYLAASHVCMLLLVAAFALLRQWSGSTQLTADAARGLGLDARTAIFALALLGFGIKAGLMPLHVWLPDAHAAAPSHVSAILSGVVIKTGVYGLLRITSVLGAPPMLWGAALLLLGAASAVLGVVYAIGQHDLKRLLAYHSIENIGIIAMGLGVALLGRWAQQPGLVVLGLSAAILHTWNHGLFKSLLFLAAGSVVHASGTREIDLLGGLSRRLPWTSALFLVGSVAICGLPPLNGFISEFLIYLAAIRSGAGGQASLVTFCAPILAITGALAVACFVKVFASTFLGQPRSSVASAAHECGWSMRLPMIALAAACLVLGLHPRCAGALLDAGVSSWSGSPLPALGSLVPFGALSAAVVAVGATGALAAVALGARARRPDALAGPTWGCGYSAPTPRMQHTASSLAQALVQLFRPLMPSVGREPRLKAPFPQPTAFATHVEDVVLQRVLLPGCAEIARGCESLRRRRSGRTQAYILSIVVTTIALLAAIVPLRRLLGWLLRS